MRNSLFSPSYGFGIVWFPKCACSMLRRFFFHLHVTEEFLRRHPRTSFHTIQHLTPYQFRPGQHYDTIHFFFRDPFARILSTFYGKHVLQTRDRLYKKSVAYMRFLVYLDQYNRTHSFYEFVRYLYLGHSIDEHDRPCVSQIPSDLPGATTYLVWRVDSPQFHASFQEHFQELCSGFDLEVPYNKIPYSLPLDTHEKVYEWSVFQLERFYEKTKTLPCLEDMFSVNLSYMIRTIYSRDYRVLQSMETSSSPVMRLSSLHPLFSCENDSAHQTTRQKTQ